MPICRCACPDITLKIPRIVCLWVPRKRSKVYVMKVSPIHFQECRPINPSLRFRIYPFGLLMLPRDRAAFMPVWTRQSTAEMQFEILAVGTTALSPLSNKPIPTERIMCGSSTVAGCKPTRIIQAPPGRVWNFLKRLKAISVSLSTTSVLIVLPVFLRHFPG